MENVFRMSILATARNRHIRPSQPRGNRYETSTLVLLDSICCLTIFRNPLTEDVVAG